MLGYHKSYNSKECMFGLLASWKKIAKFTPVEAWRGVRPEMEQLTEVPEEASAKNPIWSVEEVIAEAPRCHPLCQLKAEPMTQWIRTDDEAPTGRVFTDHKLINAVLLPCNIDADESSNDKDGQKGKCGRNEANQSFQVLMKFTGKNKVSLAQELLQMWSRYEEFQHCQYKVVKHFKLYHKEYKTS